MRGMQISSPNLDMNNVIQKYPHGDSIADYLCGLPPAECEEIPPQPCEFTIGLAIPAVPAYIFLIRAVFLLSSTLL